jgi:hypothetical protein
LNHTVSGVRVRSKMVVTITDFSPDSITEIPHP